MLHTTFGEDLPLAVFLEKKMLTHDGRWTMDDGRRRTTTHSNRSLELLKWPKKDEILITYSLLSYIINIVKDKLEGKIEQTEVPIWHYMIVILIKSGLIIIYPKIKIWSLEYCCNFKPSERTNCDSILYKDLMYAPDGLASP